MANQRHMAGSDLRIPLHQRFQVSRGPGNKIAVDFRSSPQKDSFQHSAQALAESWVVVQVRFSPKCHSPLLTLKWLCGTLECGGSTPLWQNAEEEGQGGVEPPHSKLLHT